jgi:hypothetical protein
MLLNESELYTSPTPSQKVPGSRTGMYLHNLLISSSAESTSPVSNRAEISKYEMKA